jgi:hypothetical protein
LIEKHEHFGPLNTKRRCGADGRAGTTVGAFFFASVDLMGGILNFYTLSFQILDPFVEIFIRTGKLQNHESFFSGEYAGVEDIECQIEIFC